MRKILLAAGLAAGMAMSAAAAHATVFTLSSYTIADNSTDPGLVINTSDLASTPLTFDLGATNPQTFNIFEIYTPESSVNFGEDTQPYDISVTFNFSAPEPGSATVSGDTFGVTLAGIVQYGKVVWDAPASYTWGNGGLMTIALNNATFNQGVFGLKDSGRRCDASCYGADISATFDWVRDPVPEPASWALMIGGFGLAGASLRRRRAVATAA